jgi:hypothetical protein
MANRFYLVESGNVMLESGVEFGDTMAIEIGRGRFAGLVVDVSACRLPNARSNPFDSGQRAVANLN